jgi:hypothetical protein
LLVMWPWKTFLERRVVTPVTGICDYVYIDPKVGQSRLKANIFEETSTQTGV